MWAHTLGEVLLHAATTVHKCLKNTNLRDLMLDFIYLSVSECVLTKLQHSSSFDKSINHFDYDLISTAWTEQGFPETDGSSFLF